MTQSAGTGEDSGARFEQLVGWRLRTNKLNRKSPALSPIASLPFPFALVGNAAERFSRRL